ncbi:MAG: anion permease [Candidatus Pelethousia sp.]|nr:anion permease [Candidatus Pelethousia sp.]
MGLMHKPKAALLSLGAALGLALLRPVGMAWDQSILLAATALVIFWWVTQAVNKSAASIFLLGVYLLFSRGSAAAVLRFPLSENLGLIVSSYLLAHGISTSRLVERLSRYIVQRFARNGPSLVYIAYAVSFVLIFMIPQTFPRAIILAAIYLEYLKEQKLTGEQKAVVLFSLFVAVGGTSLCFVNGDLVLNSAALAFAGISLTWTGWAAYMALPSIFISAGMCAGLLLVFRKELGSIVLVKQDGAARGPMRTPEKRAAVISAFVVALWMTESLHGIGAMWVSLLGVALMLGARLLTWRDYRVIKLELLIFLTAAFAIGGVLAQAGIVDVLFARALPKSTQPMAFVVGALAFTMALHMALGSSMTTMSVCIPVLVAAAPPGIPPVMVMFLVFIAINTHFLMPFHNVLLMVGEGEGYYDAKVTVKYGIFLTALVYISTFLVLLPYWKLVFDMPA